MNPIPEVALEWRDDWGWPVLIAVLIAVGYGLGYFVLLQHRGRRWLRHDEARLPAPGAPVDFYVLIGALNEALVIGDTVRSLVAQAPNTRVVVVDDGSDDATGELAAAAGGSRVLVVRRDPPDARRGKGAALNRGFGHITADVHARGLDPRAVIVCVMDADGQLSPGTFDEVSRLFTDSAVGAAQIPVRIRNRGRLLGRLQDMGFWGTAVVAQLGRNLSGSVSLGGNGQFARLVALTDVDRGAGPWSDSLTEDLDLTLSLQLAGWRTAAISTCFVEQEGPETLRALTRQRTRWAQGHMVCAGRIGELWRSPRVPGRTLAELGLYLFTPWIVTLLWSVMWIAFAVLGVIALVEIAQSEGVAVALATAAGAYLLAFGPLVYAALVYAHRAEDCSGPRALILMHASLLLTAVVYAATWRAAGRIVRGRTGWDKTARIGIAAPAESAR